MQFGAATRRAKGIWGEAMRCEMADGVMRVKEGGGGGDEAGGSNHS